MSEPITVARPYSKAVFAVACEDHALKQWGDALTAIEALLKEDRMSRAVRDPTCTPRQISQSVIYQLGDFLDGKTKNFVRLLAEKKRLVLIPQIKALFEMYRAKQENRVQAEVLSAMELDIDQITAMRTMLEHYLQSKVVLDCRVDQTLIAGAVIRAGDLTIDGSLQHRLARLSDTLGV